MLVYARTDIRGSGFANPLETEMLNKFTILWRTST